MRRAAEASAVEGSSSPKLWATSRLSPPPAPSEGAFLRRRRMVPAARAATAKRPAMARVERRSMEAIVTERLRGMSSGRLEGPECSRAGTRDASGREPAGDVPDQAAQPIEQGARLRLLLRIGTLLERPIKMLVGGGGVVDVFLKDTAATE